MRFRCRSNTALTMALVALSWLAAAETRGQDFPTRGIRVVVAFPAGGPTDFVARLLADKLKPMLGQSVIVENKPGANGAIGADYVAKGEPDGHLLFLTTVGAVAITPHLSKPNYDSLRDFAPVTLVVRPTTILVVKPDTPVNSAKDLAALARDKPGAIPFASTGSGSTTHLALELYQSAANVKFLHVPYRGAAPALTDLLGGQVLALFADTPVLLPHIRGGKLKPIGAASAKRNPLLPDRVSPIPSPTTGMACWRRPKRRPRWWRNCTTRSSPCSMRPTCARSSCSPARYPRRRRARSSVKS
jgi:tripartite-type tricarboxylate transporter receptor subunit TctC